MKEVEHYLGFFDASPLLDERHSFSGLEKFEKKIEQIAGIKKYIQATLYIYYIQHISGPIEIVAAAENEEQAVALVNENSLKEDWKFEQVGRETSGALHPYIILNKTE